MKLFNCIYKITSPTGKIYVGQSVNIHRRKIRYKNLDCKNQPKLYNSIKKYGFEKHTFEIIENMKKSFRKLKSKKVIDLNTNIIYDNHYDIAEKFNINPKTIYAKLAGYRKNNTTFRYEII